MTNWKLSVRGRMKIIEAVSANQTGHRCRWILPVYSNCQI